MNGERRRRRSARARAVPFWVACAGATGCLADPPTFAPRGQLPPFIIAGQVEPPLSSIYEGPRNIEINVPFRSEDVNDDLSARFFIDLVPGAADARPAQALLLAASNYEELRLLDTEVDARPGCHSLTLIMTYLDNFSLQTGLPIDDTRAARLVWWLNVGDPGGEVTMSSCPGANQVDAVPGGG